MNPALITAVSAIALAWALVAVEVPVLRAAMLSCGIAERRPFKVLLPLVAVAMLSVPAFRPLPWHEAIYSLAGSLPAPALSETAIAALVSVLFCSRISRFTSPVLAVSAALFGCLAASGAFPGHAALCTAAVWLAAPLLTVILSLAVFSLADSFIRRHRIHLLRLDAEVRFFLHAAAVLLLAAAMFNTAPAVAAFAQSASGPGAFCAGICLLGVLSGYALFFNRVRLFSWEFADRELDITTPALLAVMLAPALVLALSPLPVSPCLLILSAMLGVSMSGEEAVLEKRTAGQAALSAAATAVLSFLLGYGLTFGDNPRAVPVILILLLVVVGVTAILRVQRERDLQRSIILSRERQIESNRRSLSALEVRSEMAEKDLESKLEIKRRELVDFALGIEDQKKYMEELYAGLREARDAENPEEKDRLLDGQIAGLRDRMYFTREMNDFYAQSEILHKDFNMRLRERFPGLTANEVKLANLLRQGFSSKHIASLMNIAPKSVEINRYRLRSRLGLQRSENLINFIKSI